MDNERLNDPIEPSEKDNSTTAEEQSESVPATEDSSYEFNTYTAVSPDQSVREEPIAPLPQPPAKKGGRGAKIALCVIAVLLAILILIASAFSALAVAFIAVLKNKPVTDLPADTSSQSTEVSYEPDSEEENEHSNPIAVPSINDETPPPDSYDSDSWYNPEDLESDQLSAYEKVCSFCNPSIVAISTDVGSGSGVIWSSDGYIVTNHHVIDGASSISVMLANGERYPASRIGTNQENDLALIRINVRGLLPAELGDSDDLRMGQPVVAIGNALGILSNTATEGILSAITREITIEGLTMNLMQISAPINPGNSGGGCFDINGKLIGVVNAKTSAAGIEGLGFAIPVNTAKQIIGEMINNDDTSLQKGLGLTGCYEITPDNYAEFKVESYVGQIEKLNGGPLYGIYIISDGLVDYVDTAHTFENGDIIKSVNGEEITRLAQITELMEKMEVGDELTVTVIRMIQSGGFMNYRYSLEEYTVKIRVIELYK